MTWRVAQRTEWAVAEASYPCVAQVCELFSTLASVEAAVLAAVPMAAY